MTRETNLPEPARETTLVPQSTLPEAERLISVYLRTLSSPQTIKTYNTELTMFISFLRGEMGKELGDMAAEDISLYREHLIGKYAAATAAKKLAVLRRFLIFTYMAGATTVNPESLRFFAKSPRVRQDPAYNVLTEEELSGMLNAARASNYRDYVMLAVMAGCGLREVELVSLRIGTSATRPQIRSCCVSSARAIRSATCRSHPTSGASSSASSCSPDVASPLTSTLANLSSPRGSARTNPSPPAPSRT